MNITIVEELPELSSDELGPLPVGRIRPGNLIVPMGTKWGRLEKITVAVAVVAACVQAGRWKPLSVEEFGAVMEQEVYFLRFPKQCDQGLQALVKAGDLIVIEHQGKQYLVPTKALVDGVLHSSPFFQITRFRVTNR